MFEGAVTAWVILVGIFTFRGIYLTYRYFESVKAWRRDALLYNNMRYWERRHQRSFRMMLVVCSTWFAVLLMWWGNKN